MGEKLTGVNKYPEGLQILAEKMDLPVPQEDIETRKQIVGGFIQSILGL